MKAPLLALLMLASTMAHAAETLNAEAVKKLLTGKTALTLSVGYSAELKNYFSPDGKLYRNLDGKITVGTWSVEEDGAHCVQNIPGGCGKIVSNGDGTYDRVDNKTGAVKARWFALVDGKDF